MTCADGDLRRCCHRAGEGGQTRFVLGGRSGAHHSLAPRGEEASGIPADPAIAIKGEDGHSCQSASVVVVPPP
jgi:hypothetical protein